MKIGYQGLTESNAEEAAKLMATKTFTSIEDIEFIPLTSSKNVISALKRGVVDYGVVATKNTIGGTVQETFDAIKNEYLELVSTEILQIHHCLFKHPSANINELKYIASHIQALKQTKSTRSNRYSNLTEIEVEDTAIAAQYLNSGKLDKNCAVICRKNAGLKYNLILIDENIEDTSSNFTEFRMFKTPTINYNNDELPTFFDKFKFSLFNDSGIGFLSKILAIIAIFISFYISDLFEMSKIDTAITVGGYLSVLFLFLTSNKIKEKHRYKSIVGYWKYYSLSENIYEQQNEQKLDIPRLVKIEELDGELFLQGFICDKENVPMFESTKVFVSPFSNCKGQLIYWYTNPREINRGIPLNGIVELNWKSAHPSSKINKMSGYYFGKSTKDSGSIEYLRISEAEYNAHKQNEFL